MCSNSLIEISALLALMASHDDLSCRIDCTAFSSRIRNLQPFVGKEKKHGRGGGFRDTHKLRCLGGCNVKRQQIRVSPRKFDQTLGQGGLHDVEESIADCNPCLLNLTRIPCSQGLEERKFIQISAQRHWWVPLILEKSLT